MHCGDCIHFERIDHLHLGHCAKDEPEAIAGLWDTDRRYCERFFTTATANQQRPTKARKGRNKEVNFPKHTEPDRVILTYRHRSGGEDWKDESYPIYLDWTACHLGGQRPWFLCPARGCGRRVAILYGGGIFACRHCYQLAYPSQRETGYDRMARRADRIRDKLGWEPGILNGNGWKPKGMHWNTFEKLTAQHDAFVQDSLAGMAAKLNLLGKSPDDWI